MIETLFERDLFKVYRLVYGEPDRYGKRSVVGRPLIATEDGILDQQTALEGEAFVIGKYRATMRLDADVQPGDEVEAEGDKFTVEGRPARLRNPGFPAADHLSVHLKYVGPVTP